MFHGIQSETIPLQHHKMPYMFPELRKTTGFVAVRKLWSPLFIAHEEKEKIFLYMWYKRYYIFLLEKLPIFIELKIKVLYNSR